MLICWRWKKNTIFKTLLWHMAYCSYMHTKNCMLPWQGLVWIYCWSKWIGTSRDMLPHPITHNPIWAELKSLDQLLQWWCIVRNFWITINFFENLIIPQPWGFHQSMLDESMLEAPVLDCIGALLLQMQSYCNTKIA